MLTEVMEHFRLERDLLMAGYYETDHHRQLIKDVKASILAGRLVAVAGVVGSGKTVLLRRIQDKLTRDGRVRHGLEEPLGGQRPHHHPDPYHRAVP